MGINGDLMEQWAASFPMEVIEHHSDALFQLEALFLGQAGLLKLDTIPEQYQHDALNEGYFTIESAGTYPLITWSSLPLVNGCSGALFIKNVFEGGMLPVAGGSTFWFTLTAATSKLSQW